MFSKFKGPLICHGCLHKSYELKQDSKFVEWAFYGSCTFKDCVNSLVQCGLLAYNSNALDYLLESSLMCTYILYTISWVYFLLYHSNFPSFFAFYWHDFSLGKSNNFEIIYNICLHFEILSEKRLESEHNSKCSFKETLT